MNQPTHLNSEKKQRLWSPKYFISIFFMILILAITLLLLPKEYSWKEIKSVIFTARIEYLLLGLSMMFIYQLTIARSIQLLINAFIGQKVPIELSLKTAFIGFYFNNITPSASGGQPVEMYYLKKRGYDLAHSSIIFMMLAIYYNIVIIGLSTIMLIVKHDLIQGSLGYIRYFMYFGYFFNGLIAFLMICLIAKPNIIKTMMRGLAALLIKLHIIKNAPKFLRQMSNFNKGYLSNARVVLKQPILLIKLLILHIVQVSALFCVPYFVRLSLGGKFNQFWDCFALQSVLYVSTSAVPTPGAVGITESGFITMFNSIMPQNQVLPGMILTRFINLYGFLIISAVVTTFAFILIKRDQTHIETAHLHQQSNSNGHIHQSNQSKPTDLSISCQTSEQPSDADLKKTKESNPSR